MIRFCCSLLFAALATASINAPAPAGMADPIYGVWRNPKGSVDVQTQPCAGALCGQIVRADAKAMNDARKKGVTSLIGLELLQDYHRDNDSWSGRVYVPDLGRTFSSQIAMIGHDQIKISGCLIGGFLCKSQVWRRV
jgi:uncharacterized protein (DUF2147 family)